MLDAIGQMHRQRNTLVDRCGVFDHAVEIGALVFQVVHRRADQRHRLVERGADLAELRGVLGVAHRCGHDMVGLRHHDRACEDVAHVVVDLTGDARAFVEPGLPHVGGAALVETKTWLTLSMAFCVAAVAIPTWAMFLPLVACDLAYQLVFCATPRTRHAKYVLTAAPCAAACVVTGMALMSIGGVWPHDARALACMLLVPLTVLAAVAGWMRADGLRSQMRYRALADARRERRPTTVATVMSEPASRASNVQMTAMSTWAAMSAMLRSFPCRVRVAALIAVVLPEPFGPSRP